MTKRSLEVEAGSSLARLAERALRERVDVGFDPHGALLAKRPPNPSSCSLGGLEGHEVDTLGIEPRASCVLSGRGATGPRALPELAVICWDNRCFLYLSARGPDVSCCAMPLGRRPEHTLKVASSILARRVACHGAGGLLLLASTHARRLPRRA